MHDFFLIKFWRRPAAPLSPCRPGLGPDRDRTVGEHQGGGAGHGWPPENGDGAATQEGVGEEVKEVMVVEMSGGGGFVRGGGRRR